MAKVYPEDYKCVSCEKYHTYGCRNRHRRGMLGCSDYVATAVRNNYPYPRHLGLLRCMLNVCPQYKLI